jgi:hypothetical protein
MNLYSETVIRAIEKAPYNMGLTGAAWLASEGNKAVTFDDCGVVLFDHEGGHEYQAHFLLNTHGRQAVEQAKCAFRIMFTQHRAELIFGLVPDFRRDVKMVARWAGAKSVGKRKTAYGDCELFVLSNLMFFKKADQ